MQRDAWDRHELPPIEQVGTRTWSIPVPVPDLPIRYTLAYLLIGDSGGVLIDPGWDSPGGAARIREGLDAAGLTIGELRAVAVTHAHRDHLGLAGWLRADGAGPVLLSPAEHAAAGAETTGRFRRIEDDYLAALGVPAPDRTALVLPDEAVDSIVASPPRDGDLLDGGLLPLQGRRISVLSTPGHSPGSICLFDADDGLLLTGDTLLPRISPNIGLAIDGGVDPLADYQRSLDRLARLAPAEVLPGHEWRFTDAAGRIAVLQAHHAERLAEAAELLRERGPSTAWGIAKALRWARPWAELTGFQRRIATAEAAAHLVRLVGTDDAAVTDGVYRATVTRSAAPPRVG